jgi:LPS-assembly protein
MLKLLLLLAIFTLYAVADDRAVEVYATSMSTQGDIVKADGEVVVIYQDYFLSAKRAIYNKESGELELFENISATQGSNVRFLGQYAKLNIAQKERSFKPFYMLEERSEVWLSGAESYSKESDIDIRSGVMSG